MWRRVVGTFLLYRAGLRFGYWFPMIVLRFITVADCIFLALIGRIKRFGWVVFRQKKSRHEACEFCLLFYGVADGVRTHDHLSHNQVRYHCATATMNTPSPL